MTSSPVATDIQTDPNIEVESTPSEVEDYESTPSSYEIVTYPADFTLEVLYHQWKKGDIEVPDFQRRFVWRPAQASKLIESFLSGLPVPAIFLYQHRETKKYLVIDGQQRLMSVFGYMEGRFNPSSNASNDTDFKLVGLSPDSPYNQKTFSTLPEEDQRTLNNSVLRAFIVQQLNPKNDTSIYHIFERLNTGGTFLSNQEIRNCIFRGNFVDFVLELNKFDYWRSIMGRQLEDDRGRDVELIVRFFAMRNRENYKKPMKDYLSGYMRAMRRIGENEQDDLRDLFERTCRLVVSNLGEKPFHFRSGLNAAAFDSVMANIANFIDEVPVDIGERYRRLTEDVEFQSLIREATTDENTVRKRFLLVAEALFNG